VVNVTKMGRELGFEILLHPVAALQHRAQHGSGATGQDGRVGHENEIPESLRLLQGVEQVSFCSERDMLQVLERAQGVHFESQLAEQPPVVGREWQHHGAQILPQSFRLQSANGSFRQSLPPVA
jgi:hypothetical protein